MALACDTQEKMHGALPWGRQMIRVRCELLAVRLGSGRVGSGSCMWCCN